MFSPGSDPSFFSEIIMHQNAHFRVSKLRVVNIKIISTARQTKIISRKKIANAKKLHLSHYSKYKYCIFRKYYYNILLFFI